MTTLDVLIEELGSFRRSLAEMLGETHRFRRISASQSDHAYGKFKAMQPLTDAEWVATMFAAVGHVREFQTSVFVTSCVMRQFITTIEQAHSRRDLISVLGYLRSLLERIAHLHFVTKFVSDKLDKAPNSESHPFISTFDIDMRNALYGTTMKINEIAGKQLQDIDLKKDIGKGLRQDLGLHFAKQIFDKIDMLDKDVPGTRAAYEILCDYLHPNVGDLLATTLSYTELVDRFGIKHIVREIGIGTNRFEAPTADRVVLSRIYELMLKLVETSLDNFGRCNLLKVKLDELARSATRQAIRKQKRMFKKTDLCPCCSGEQIFKCCGRGLLWRIKVKRAAQGTFP